MPSPDRLSTAPTDADIIEAMRELDSFMDITPSDARELFRVAHVQTLRRLREAVRVRDLMTRQVVSLEPETPLPEAARTLAEAGISGAPVVSRGQLLGVVSVKDFLGALGLPKNAPPVALVAQVLGRQMQTGNACAPADLERLLVRDIMTAPALAVDAGMAASDAAQLMSSNAIRRLPVTEAGELAGMITHTDLLRAFGVTLGQNA